MSGNPVLLELMPYRKRQSQRRDIILSGIEPKASILTAWIEEH